jgi:hypothetical protein
MQCVISILALRQYLSNRLACVYIYIYTLTQSKTITVIDCGGL